MSDNINLRLRLVFQNRQIVKWLKNWDDDSETQECLVKMTKQSVAIATYKSLQGQHVQAFVFSGFHYTSCFFIRRVAMSRVNDEAPFRETFNTIRINYNYMTELVVG